jgi:hypothetical protein
LSDAGGLMASNVLDANRNLQGVIANTIEAARVEME